MTSAANDPESYLNRGICLMKKGRSNDAVSDFQRVLKLTNHSDFAEPAKNYLRQFESQTQSSAPATNANTPRAPPFVETSPKTTSYDRIGSDPGSLAREPAVLGDNRNMMPGDVSGRADDPDSVPARPLSAVETAR